MFYTIATAGHIDHGKSTLVRALTGIDPDRLPEEKQREMTIDLGFAWFKIEDGSEVGIVDVPGHERFIRNMIAGVGGIDFVLFIVASDDGWMPQSQEHLEILNYLDHRHGAVVMTKTDLVKTDWLELVKEDIKSNTKNTFLENAPIFSFSSKGNQGLDEILEYLSASLPQLPPRENPLKPRLYTDRVFSMAGIGTVVTGTMRDGGVKQGQDLKIIPSGKSARIKSIQTFKQQRKEAFIGARTALSLTGISKHEISRGDCLVPFSEWEGTNSIALKIRTSPACRIPLTHNRSVIVLIGTTEIESKVRLFRDEKPSNESDSICLMEFDRKVMARIGDNVILRYPTPDVLVGGGVVVDVDLAKFIRRDKDLRKFYLDRNIESVKELILSELRKYKTRPVNKILQASNFSRASIDKELKNLISKNAVEQYGNLLVNVEFKNKLFAKIEDYLTSFHKNTPSRLGVSKSELVSKLKQELSVIDFALDELQKSGKLEIRNKLVKLTSHTTGLKPEQENIKTEIMQKLAVSDYQTPTRKVIERKIHAIREVLNFLIQSGEIIELSEGILYTAADFKKITAIIKEQINAKGSVQVKHIKDRLGLSRKYIIPILEYLDKQGITRREGDKRVLNG